jgi:hypothetical protein
MAEVAALLTLTVQHATAVGTEESKKNLLLPSFNTEESNARKGPENKKNKNKKTCDAASSAQHWRRGVNRL